MNGCEAIRTAPTAERALPSRDCEHHPPVNNGTGRDRVQGAIRIQFVLDLQRIVRFHRWRLTRTQWKIETRERTFSSLWPINEAFSISNLLDALLFQWHHLLDCSDSEYPK